MKSKQAAGSEAPQSEHPPFIPCPVLRALAQAGKIKKKVALPDLSRAVAKAFDMQSTDLKEFLFELKVRAIATVGKVPDGIKAIFSPSAPLDLEELPESPLYKKGVSSQIFDAKGDFNAQQFEHLKKFASSCTGPDGKEEPGLTAANLTKFMDENSKRAENNPHWSPIYRKMMEGEWPPLLELMGKEGKSGPYLSVAELRTLFEKQSFPERIQNRLK